MKKSIEIPKKYTETVKKLQISPIFTLKYHFSFRNPLLFPFIVIQ